MATPAFNNTVYYLPGYGGQLATGLGQGLMERGFDVTGRETRNEFRALPFAEQVQAIQHDLTAHFWNPEAQVVCNSFGAYLFLHAQAVMEPFVGRVLRCRPSWVSSPTSWPARVFRRHVQRDCENWLKLGCSSRHPIARFTLAKMIGKVFLPTCRHLGK